MKSLQHHVRQARRLLEHEGLAEATVGLDPLIETANHWRAFIRMGDSYLEAVQRVADAAVLASEAEDALTARRANADVGSAVRAVSNVTGRAYTHFASGREQLYQYARLFDVSTKRSGKAGKSPANIRTATDEELRKEVAKGAVGLAHGIKKMLDLGSKVQRDFRDGAILTTKAGEDLALEIVNPLVSEGLDFRDAVSVNVFARTNGVMRRATELSRRAWELMMMEDNKTGWTAPWESDPEFGGVELI